MKKQAATKTQSDAFIAAAKAAECDEDEAAWDRRLKAVAKAPAKAVPKPAKKSTKR